MVLCALSRAAANRHATRKRYGVGAVIRQFYGFLPVLNPNQRRMVPMVRSRLVTALCLRLCCVVGPLVRLRALVAFKFARAPTRTLPMAVLTARYVKKVVASNGTCRVVAQGVSQQSCNVQPCAGAFVS